MEDLLEIGFVYRTHGYKGDLRIRLLSSIRFKDGPPAAFFIKTGEEFIPYFVKSFTSMPDNEALVHFEDVDNKEIARKLHGRAIYLRREEAEVDSGEDSPYSFIGFLVRDMTTGDVGVVQEVLSYPQQDLLSVRHANRDVLIPLREELIIEIDMNNKRIVFDLPLGLLDI